MCDKRIGFLLFNDLEESWISWPPPYFTHKVTREEAANRRLRCCGFAEALDQFGEKRCVFMSLGRLWNIMNQITFDSILGVALRLFGEAQSWHLKRSRFWAGKSYCFSPSGNYEIHTMYKLVFHVRFFKLWAICLWYL